MYFVQRKSKSSNQSKNPTWAFRLTASHWGKYPIKWDDAEWNKSDDEDVSKEGIVGDEDIVRNFVLIISVLLLATVFPSGLKFCNVSLDLDAADWACLLDAPRKLAGMFFKSGGVISGIFRDRFGCKEPAIVVMTSAILEEAILDSWNKEDKEYNIYSQGTSYDIIILSLKKYIGFFKILWKKVYQMVCI